MKIKLITMTDFALENPSSNAKIINYANFLKKTLKLEMFVPCDEKGNVFDKKSIYADKDKYYMFESEKYDDFQQAKEKVLFEGFKVFDNNKNIEISNGRINLFFSIRNWVGILEVDKTIRVNTIEDLTKYDLTLTPNAL